MVIAKSSILILIYKRLDRRHIYDYNHSIERRLSMGLKEYFLTYVEREKCAYECKEQFGVNDSRTVESFAKANDVKRKLLNIIEELDYE